MTTALHSLPQMVLGYVPTDLQRLATQTIPPLPERPVVRVDLRMPDQPYRAFAFLFAQQANHSEVEHRLQSSLPGQPSDGTTWWGPELTSPPPPPSLAWVMPGSGALGGDFYGALGTIDSVVDAVRQEAEGYFANYTGQQVSFLALGEDGDERSLNPLYQRPATVTASVAMARLLQNFGIQPDFLAGHSVGELTACHLAGCFDLAQLIRLTTAPFIGGTLAPGAMAALMGNENTILELVQQSAGQVMVSNRNSPQQLVISGAAQAVHDLVAQAKAKRVKAIPLKVATAYHSPFLAEPHALYREVLAHSTFHPANRPVVSGLTADVLPWSNQDFAQTRALLDCGFIGPVNHVGQIQRLHALGAKVYLDIGPTSKHVRLIKETLPEPIVLGANPNKTPGRQGVLECLAQLHVLGYPLTIS